MKNLFPKANKISISTQTCFHDVDQSTQTSYGTSSVSLQVSPNLREESTQYIFEAVSDSTQTDLIVSNGTFFQGGHLFNRQEISIKRRLEKRVERTILVLTNKYYMIAISSSLILFIKNARLLELIDMLKLEKIIKQSHQAVWKVNYKCTQKYLSVLYLILYSQLRSKKS